LRIRTFSLNLRRSVVRNVMTSAERSVVRGISQTRDLLKRNRKKRESKNNRIPTMLRITERKGMSQGTLTFMNGSSKPQVTEAPLQIERGDSGSWKHF